MSGEDNPQQTEEDEVSTPQHDELREMDEQFRIQTQAQDEEEQEEQMQEQEQEQEQQEQQQLTQLPSQWQQHRPITPQQAVEKQTQNPHLIQLFVTQMSGARLACLKVHPAHEVGDVAKAISRSAGVSEKSTLLLAFDNKVIPDFCKVSEANLRNGSVVTAIRFPELFVAVAHEDGSLALWSAETGLCERLVQGNRGALMCVTFSPDGALLISGCMDGSLTSWSVLTGQREAVYVGHHGAVACVDCAPDGETLVSGSADKSVRIWGLYSGECLGYVPGHSGAVGCLSFALRGGLMATGSVDQTVKVWKFERRRCIQTLEGHQKAITCLCFDPDGTLLASGSTDTHCRIWSLEDDARCWRKLKGHKAPIVSVAFLPPQAALIAVGISDGAVLIWDVQEATCVRGLGSRTGPDLGSLACSPAGTYLALGLDDGVVQLYSPTTGKKSFKFMPHSRERPKENSHKVLENSTKVHAIAFSAGLGPTGAERMTELKKCQELQRQKKLKQQKADHLEKEKQLAIERSQPKQYHANLEDYMAIESKTRKPTKRLVNERLQDRLEAPMLALTYSSKSSSEPQLRLPAIANTAASSSTSSLKQGQRRPPPPLALTNGGVPDSSKVRAPDGRMVPARRPAPPAPSEILQQIQSASFVT
eukprot:TRINITY_DN20899_c0_g1_i1.p1 TRINITY_DN20899_c0_g1~~TRINITY_DN20899_c0_g1_i1.p1  ORF type:complete len:647 (+),score=106.37 TRINITY_DN20899_c0_g1_i1:79-2019(+)